MHKEIICQLIGTLCHRFLSSRVPAAEYGDTNAVRLREPWHNISNELPPRPFKKDIAYFRHRRNIALFLNRMALMLALVPKYALKCPLAPHLSQHLADSDRATLEVVRKLVYGPLLFLVEFCQFRKVNLGSPPLNPHFSDHC